MISNSGQKANAAKTELCLIGCRRLMQLGGAVLGFPRQNQLKYKEAYQLTHDE